MNIMSTNRTNHAGHPRLRTFAKKASGSKSSRAGIALPLLIGILAVSPTRQAEAQSWTGRGTVDERMVLEFHNFMGPGLVGWSSLRARLQGGRGDSAFSLLIHFDLDRPVARAEAPAEGSYRFSHFLLCGAKSPAGRVTDRSPTGFGTLRFDHGLFMRSRGAVLSGSDPAAVRAEFDRISEKLKTLIGDPAGRTFGFNLTGVDGTPWKLGSGSILTVTMTAKK